MVITAEEARQLAQGKFSKINQLIQVMVYFLLEN